MKFTKAVRKQAKLRLALTAPSGAGKTYGALMIAKGLGGRIAVIDTERGSASLYSHLVEFDTLELNPPYSPERYIEAIRAAEQAGYDIIIIDSTTHEWNGTGGALEINETLAKSKFGGNTWAAWNETTPRHRAFIDCMLQAKSHIIATGRSKTETAQADGPNGRKKVVKLGMKTEQRDGFEFEFTVVLDIIHEGHYAAASKDRTGLFSGDPKPISEQTGKDLLAWLNSGVEMLPEPPKPDSEPGKVTPTAGAMDRVAHDRVEVVEHYAAELKRANEAGDSLAAAQLANEIQDADEKTAVWSLLDSKTRSFIKAAVALAKQPQPETTE